MEFRNPEGYWEYGGPYSVVVSREADTDNLPDGASVERRSGYKIVRVKDGRIKQTIGRIEFYAGEKAFSLGYLFIEEIRDSTGIPIWRNRRYQ